MTVFRVTLNQTHSERVIANVLHFDVGITGNPRWQQDACLEMVNGWISIVRQNQSSEVAYTSVNVKEVFSPELESYTHFITPTLKGVGSGLATPQSLVLSLRTGSHGRSRRGRVYLAGPYNMWFQYGRVTGNYLSSLSAMINSLLARYGIASNPTYRLGVYSRKLREWESVQNIVPYPYVGIQRGRLR